MLFPLLRLARPAVFAFVITWGLTLAAAQSAPPLQSSETNMAMPPIPRDPLPRALYLRSPKPAALARAYQALLAGDMSAFALLARATQLGHALPREKGADSPAARFFQRLLHEAPAAERDAFLALGLAGQISNPGLLERSPRVALSAPEPARAWLLRYLAAFDTPLRSLTPRAPLGERLKSYAHYPHPMFVRIAGDLGLRDALPHLERFLRVQRRFYLLRTDYSTHPQEVDALFLESLRAALRIAEQQPDAVPEVRALLQRAQTQAAAEEQGDPLSGDGEPVLLETYNDNQGTAPPTIQVSPSRLRSDEFTPSKQDWLKVALRSLQRAATAASELDAGRLRNKAPRLQVPGAAWTQPSDAAQVALSGSTLFVLTRQFVEGQHRPVLWSLDLPSGRSRFVLRLMSSEAKTGAESELATRGLCTDPDGSPVLLLSEFVRPGHRPSSLVRFDAGTGEVAAVLPLASDSEEDPVLLRCDASGYVLRRGAWLFRHSLGGELVFRHKLAPEAKLAVSQERIVVLSSDGVHQLSGEASPASVRPLPLRELIGEKELPSSAFPLALSDGFAIAQGLPGKLRIYDPQGRLRSESNLPEGTDAFTSATGPWAQRILTARDQLWVLGAGDRLIKLKVPLNLREVLVTPLSAYVADERSYVEHHLRDGSSRKLNLPGSAHMAQVLAASAHWLIVLVYRDGYFLAALPLPAQS